MKLNTAYSSLIQSLLDYNKPSKSEPMAQAMQIDSVPAEKEIRMNYLKPFTGKWDYLNKFLLDCDLYLHINKKVYDEDIKKISFVLTLMTEGECYDFR